MSTSRGTLDTQLSINDILRHHPAAVSVLSAHGIDRCCRGNLSLADAASELGIDAARVAGEIVAGEGIEAEAAPRCSCGCGHSHTK